MNGPDKRQINFTVSDKVYNNIVARARARGMAVGAFTKMLFEAAYSARIGREKGNPTTDAELDDQVRAVFLLAGEIEPKAIADAIGLPVSLVERIIAGWGLAGKGRAA